MSRALDDARVRLERLTRDIQDFADTAGVDFIKAAGEEGAGVSTSALRMVAGRVPATLERMSASLSAPSIDSSAATRLLSADAASLIADLRRTGRPRAEQIAAELEREFSSYYELACEEIGRALTRTAARVRGSENHRALLCAHCGQPAAEFSAEESGDGHLLVYTGLRLWPKPERVACSARERDVMFRLLDDGNVAGAHRYVNLFTARNRAFLVGINVYCPDCDAVYCHDHWTLREDYDDGFYDGTRGRCPQMHWRIVED